MSDGERGETSKQRAEPLLRPHEPSESLLAPRVRKPAPRKPRPPRPRAPVAEAPPPPAATPPPAVAAPEEPVALARPRAAPILSDEQRLFAGEIVARAARIALAVGIFAVPVVFDPRSLDIFNLAKITLLWTTVLAVLGLAIAAAVLGGDVTLPRSRTLWAALVLVAITAAATAASTNRSLSLYGLYHRYGGLLALLLYVVCGVLVAVLYARRRDALREIAVALVGSAVVVAAYVLVQRAGLDPFQWLAATGTQPAHPIGTLGNADVAGAFLAMAVPFAAYLTAATRRIELRVASAVGGVIVLTALVFTHSGIGIAAAAAGLVALVLFGSAASRLVKGCVVGGIVLAAALAPVIASHSAGYRLEVSDAGWRMAVQRPVVGWGPETFYGNYGRFRSASDARNRGLTIPDEPHNVYVQWAESAGFAGLIAFLVLLGSVVWLVAGRTTSLPRHRRLLGAALGASLVAYVVQAMYSVDAPPIAMTLWVAIGASVALLSRPSTPTASKRTNARWRVAVAAVVVIAAGAGAWTGFGPLRADHAAWASDRFGAGWSDDSARLHAKAIRLNRREAAYRSLAAAYFERVAGVDGTPITGRQALLAAVALYKAAVELQPRNVYYALDVARAYAMLGRRHPEYFPSADEWFRRALDIDPRDPQVHALRAAVLSQWAAHTKDPVIAARALTEQHLAQSLRDAT